MGLGASYAANEAVQHDGTAWIALRANTDVTPEAGDDWSLFALGVTASCQRWRTRDLERDGVGVHCRGRSRHERRRHRRAD